MKILNNCKKIIALLMTVCIMIVPISFNVEAAGYNSSAAVNYAAQHWNDGQGLCAEFVSNCLSAGGCSAWSVWVADLWTYLNNGGWGTGYTLTKSGSYINLYQNSGKLSAGDPIFYYCNSCGSWTHVVLCSGFNSSANAMAYGHNGAWNNEQYLGGYYDGHGHSGSAITVYSFHMTQGAQGDITLSFPTNGVTEVGENYFKLYFETSNPGTTVTTAGIRIRETNSSSWYTHTENIPSNIGNVSLLKTNYVVGSGQEINYNIQPGTTYIYQAYAIAGGKTYYSNQVTFTSKGTNAYDASSTTATLSSTNFIYSGSRMAPSVIIKNKNGIVLIRNTDYTLTYPSNSTKAGSYSIKVTFKGKYSGTKYLTYKINTLNSSNTIASLSATTFTYSGSRIAPAVVIKDKKGNQLVRNRDYTLTYPTASSKVGTYKIKVNFIGSCSGSKTLTYKINTLSAANTIASLSASSFTYSGSRMAPAVVIKDKKGNQLVRNRDYTLTYPTASSKVGTYTIKVNFIGSCSGSKTLTYKIKPMSAANTISTLSRTSFTYSGSRMAPSVVIKDKKGNLLVRNRDYTLTYPTNSSKVGSYTIKVKFIGNYSGSKNLTYKIISKK